MLAPTKRLFSTPQVIADVAIEMLGLTPASTLVDVGCGDGSFLIRAAALRGCKCVGVEIDGPRAELARGLVAEAKLEHLITIHTGNALAMDISEATHLYLYLVPRGYRALLPMLRALPKPVRYKGGADTAGTPPTHRRHTAGTPPAHHRHTRCRHTRCRRAADTLPTRCRHVHAGAPDSAPLCALTTSRHHPPH